MATKKTIELEVNTNAEQAKKGIDDLGQSVDNLNQAEKKVQKTNKDLHASFEDVYGEVKPLTAQMGEMEDRLYQMALAGDTASKEFNDLLSEVGKYRKVQMDTDMVVDASATTMSQKLGGAIQGAASGFALAQGAMGLFGTESEELEKTLLKVQSAMAITQGLEGLREGAKSFMAMGMAAKKALSGIKAGVAATGIGVFLVALAAVVAYWEDITALVSSYTSEVEDAAEAQDKLNKKRQDELKGLNERINKNQNLVDGQVKVIKNEEKIKDLQAEGIDNQDEINKLTRENLLLERNRLQFIIASNFDLLNTQQQIEIKAKRYRIEQELLRMEIIANREEEKKLEEQRKKDFEEAEKRAAKRAERRAFNLQIERELEDLRIAQLKEGYDKEVILINTQAKRIREDILANDKLTSTQRTELLVEQERIRQGKIIALGERRGEVEFEQMEVRGAAEIELHEKIEDKKLQITKDYDETRKQQAQQTAQAVANIAIDGLRLVSDIADMFASKDEKLAKRAFNIKKAADIAEATMSGYKAVISTYANAPGGVVLKSIQAAIAGAFSAVQIAKIASAKFEGGQVASDLGDTSAGAGGGAMPQPSFNVVGDSGINQLAELQMQPTQAFVVSGDITTAQSLDRNKIQNATI